VSLIPHFVRSKRRIFLLWEVGEESFKGKTFWAGGWEEKHNFKNGVSKRGLCPLFLKKPSPSPLRERGIKGIKGVRVLNNYLICTFFLLDARMAML